jgi:fumarate hydratase class II
MFKSLVSILLLSATLCAAQEIKIIVAEGVGSDPQNAAQDAAQNALTNVVGSFIDANKQLEKRSEIRDGIRSQTRQIRTEIKEYSQGSIRSFEVVEMKNEGSLFRVTAKVGVRVEDFHAYIKKLAEGETAVGGGLFAEMATSRNQSESLAKILSERILAVVNG